VHTVNPFFVETEWLARAHGHAPTSDADARGRLSRGISPERIAGAIAGCLTAPRSRTVAVPRWAGLARLTWVSPVDRVLNRVLSRRVGTIRRLAERAVRRRIDGPEGVTEAAGST